MRNPWYHADMPLTSTEAAAAVTKLRALAEDLVDALEPDDDGKICVTRAELGDIGRQLVGALITVVVDLVD